MPSAVETMNRRSSEVATCDQGDRAADRLVAVRPQIAIYADSWWEFTFSKLSAALDSLPAGFRPVFIDYGPTPNVPETSASVPPWKGRVHAAIIDTATQGDPLAMAEWIRRGEVPVVSLNAELLDTGIPTVCADYRELARLAAKHLADACGCRSFVHVGFTASQATARREDAFREQLVQRGHVLHAVRTRVGLTTNDAAPPPLDDPMLKSLLQTLPRPIGVFVGQDAYAAGAVAVCRQLALRVPDDVAVLGIGNSMIAHTHRPSLSSLHVQRAAVGTTGMALLRALLHGEREPAEPMLTGGSVLHARESTVGRLENTSDLTVDVAMERIAAEACAGLTVDRLAGVLKVSDRWLRKLFEEELGVSPNHEIQRVRFEHAARLLKHTSIPMSRIAAMVGFSHATGLSMFFRRMIGMTPREYRAAALTRRRASGR